MRNLAVVAVSVGVPAILIGVELERRAETQAALELLVRESLQDEEAKSRGRFRL